MASWHDNSSTNNTSMLYIIYIHLHSHDCFRRSVLSTKKQQHKQYKFSPVSYKYLQTFTDL